MAGSKADAAPLVSVVIPHLDTPDLLMRCLASVVEQQLTGGLFEVIVVDNGSRQSLEPVRQAFPSVRFLSEPQPGPGPARNTGAAAAAARVLAFIDADCRADAGWLQAALDGLGSEPDSAVVGGDVRIDFIDPEKLTGVEAYEAVFAYRQRWYIETLNFSGTGNLAMGRAVLDRVGPFGGLELAEDRDWGRRATAAGYRVRYIAGMRIFHPGRTSFAQLTRKWERHTAHDYHDHMAAGRSPLAWRLRAVAVFLSAFVHGSRMLTSDRLAGFGNRWRGLKILVRIRAWRMAEMLRVARGDAQGAAAAWRRT